jgi:beta-galactosidase
VNSFWRRLGARLVPGLAIAAWLVFGAVPTPGGGAQGPSLALPDQASPRELLRLDTGWKFHLGDAASIEGDFGYGQALLYAKAGEAGGAVAPDFDDSSWRTLDLPHDWAVEQDFVQVDDENVCAHGYKPIGRQFPKTTIGWYRKTFTLPKSDRGRRLAVRFDGVFRDCQVWFNGNFLGRNFSGYSGFLFDLTDYAEFDRPNVLVVRVDASLYEGWFYEGAGIYRHVWLEKYDWLHIPEYGLFVWTEVGPQAAQVNVETQVFNQSLRAASGELRTFILDDRGRTVASSDPEPFRLEADLVAAVKQRLPVSNPRLWSLEDPALYRLVSEVRSGGRLVDRKETEFGIRTVLFDKDRGFFLNGRPVKIQGVCCHQDHGGVGSALPDALQYYRIARLKEMGCNAYRTSHNPPTPELLQACDRLGMLVMDENRLMGSAPELLGQFEHLILRDRNHPSVIIWSLGNEEFTIQDTPTGRRIAQSLKQRQRELDPTRLCTYAGNNGRNFAGINEVVDVRGFNYHLDEIEAYRAEHPDQPLWGAETASTVCTRGIYANDTERGYVADYDLNFPPWASTAETWWSLYAVRPWLAGGFAWTGFDYRGEPTPYAWPCINSHFGIMDMCGFPKNIYYYYQAWWTDKDVLHLSPHWNWPGREGQVIDVWCHSNCDSVELFLNGRSLGRRDMPRYSHLEWKVPYEPGVLSAKGWRGGRVVTARVETTGDPVSLRLEPDRASARADGEDVVVFTVSALDGLGRSVPVADNLVRFAVSGPGRIVGVGNGDPSSHEPDKYLQGPWQRHLFNGLCQVIVQTTRETGSLALTASSEGLQPAAVSVPVEPGRVLRRVE